MVEGSDGSATIDTSTGVRNEHAGYNYYQAAICVVQTQLCKHKHRHKLYPIVILDQVGTDKT